MAIFVPNDNLEKNLSVGQAVNKAIKQYIKPELRRLGKKDFGVAGIEIFSDGKHKVFLDEEVQMVIGFKNRKVSPSENGKLVALDLHDIKTIEWKDKTLDKNSGKILIIHFSKEWWIWNADLKKIKGLEDKFKIVTTHAIRGNGYLPLTMRRQEKDEFLQGWKGGLNKELPAMWTRHITVSQRYSGVMVYDGNYFDLFSHAQELYVLGYYYSSIVVCRVAAEQALVCILLKVGQGFEIYRPKTRRGDTMIKGIKELIDACRDQKLFHGRYPINKASERKLREIARIANNLVHLQQDLSELNAYRKNALKCMDNLQFVIKKHLNFVKDTGVVSGYRFFGSAKRLK